MIRFERILVVCIGNICRSPTAEFMLRRILPGTTISSAGLGALVGEDMDATARLVAEAHGLACPPHQARQLSREMCSQVDLILVMESRHREVVARISPEARGKTFLLRQGLDGPEVRDPYRRSQETFEVTYQLLAEGCEAWAARIAASN